MRFGEAAYHSKDRGGGLRVGDAPLDEINEWERAGRLTFTASLEREASKTRFSFMLQMTMRISIRQLQRWDVKQV